VPLSEGHRDAEVNGEKREVKKFLVSDSGLTSIQNRERKEKKELKKKASKSGKNYLRGESKIPGDESSLIETSS